MKPLVAYIGALICFALALGALLAVIGMMGGCALPPHHVSPCVSQTWDLGHCEENHPDKYKTFYRGEDGVVYYRTVYKPWTWRTVAFAGTAVALAIGDIATTEIAAHNGAHEANPIYPKDEGARLGVMVTQHLLILMLAAVMGDSFGGENHDLAWVAPSLLLGAATIWNASVAAKGHAR